LNLYRHIRERVGDFSENTDPHGGRSLYEKCCQCKQEEAAYMVDNTNTRKRIKQ
jgi:hypothetical protein